MLSRPYVGSVEWSNYVMPLANSDTTIGLSVLRPIRSAQHPMPTSPISCVSCSVAAATTNGSAPPKMRRPAGTGRRYDSTACNGRSQLDCNLSGARL